MITGVFFLMLTIGPAALSACAPVEGRYINPKPALKDGKATAFQQPDDHVLLLFNHGSRAEPRADQCDPDGRTTPGVIKSLAGEEILGLTIAVYAYCTPSRKGSYRHQQAEGDPKVLNRTRDIEVIVADYQARGLAPERVFLAGQSAGAWASLLVARRGLVTINSVIGFAPAFAGRRGRRPPGWQQLRDDQIAYLHQAPRLDALIFAFVGDPYEPPEALSFLRNVPGIELRALPSDVIDGVPCRRRTPHFTSFQDCFMSSQRQTILDYMAARLAATQES